MGVSKVTLNGVTLMDVTDKTVDTDNLLAGNSALRNDGESITGAVVTASPSDASPAMDGTASAGVATTYSRGDHVHPSDTNKANINNPSFTGTPTAPTASKGTNTTQIATTAFVQSAITDINYPVTSVNTKTGAVVLTASDVNALPDTTVIPTATSDLTNDSNFVSDANYVHTDNNFTNTLKDKLDGIAEGATVDDHKWNDVTLNKTTISSGTVYLAGMSSSTSTNAYLLTAKIEPTAQSVAMYNSSKQLSSTTPAVGDSSTAVATTAFVSNAISSLGSILNYKGTKATESALPSTGNVTGDVWIVSADNSEYVWNGTAWEKLGPTIDLSGYVPTTRTVNGKALSTDISLDASDVGALPDSTIIPDISGKVNKSGDTMAGNLIFNSGAKIRLEYGSSSTYTDIGASGNNGSTTIIGFTSNLTNNKVILDNIAAPTDTYHAANKKSVDDKVAAITVPVTSVNSKTGAVVLTAADVGALPDTTAIPTATSDLTNDSGFITSSDIPVISVNNKTGAVSLTASDIGALPSSTDLSVYMQKGVDYVTAGKKTDTTLGTRATAEGQNNTASGNYSHAEGYLTTASGSHTHAEGQGTTASGQYGAHAEGQATTASGSYGSHAEGSYTTASSSSSHAEGQFSSSIGNQAHSEGYATLARGNAAHSEGSYTRAYGNQAHAEGIGTNAFASYSHAEGSGTYYTIHVTAGQSEKEYNITEDNIYIPYGANYSNFGIMDFTYAKKWYLVTGASTQGTDPQKKLTSITLDEALSSSVIQNNAPLTLVLSGAVHNYSHVEGQSNISGSPAQHVGGKFNVVTSGAEVIGGGTSNTERANIRTLDWSGNEMLAGKLTVGAGPTNNMDVATKTYVDTAIAGVESLPSQTGQDGKFLTTNGTTASWESLPEEVFVATYGTTTLAEILEAYNAGKFIYAVKSNNPGRLVPLEEYVSSIPQFYFSYITRGGTPQDWAVSNSGWTSTANTFGYVPTTRTINSKSLSNSITLTASDVGALPDSTTIPTATSDLTNDSGFITSSDIPVTSVNNKTGAVSLTASDVGALTNSYFGYFDADNNIVYAPKNWNSSYLFPFVVRAISSTLRTGATVRAFDSSTNLWTISSIYYDGVAKTLPLVLNYGIYLMRYSDGTTDIYRIAKASDIPTLTSTPTANKGAQYDSSAYLNSTTPAANDNSTKVATTAYVDNAVSSVDALPDQTGQDGKFLTTNGTTASWADNPPEIFWITVNTSTLTADKTFAEIAAAVNDNKLPVVFADGNSIYLFLYLGTTYMRFTRYIGASGKGLRCNSDDTWEIDYNANLQEQITASGLLKGDGSGGVSTATAGTDYVASESDPTVPSWAKASTKPTYTYTEVGAAASSHTHAAGDITSGTLDVARGGTAVTSADLITATYGVEYIAGTQTAATNAWTGVTKSAALFTGKTIAYKLPYAGTSSNATLTLTFPNGGNSGGKAVLINNSNVTTHFPAGTVILLVYDGSYWRVDNYNSNTTYSAGTGLSLSSTTFNHSNSVTAGTAGTSSATSGATLAVPYVTYDAQGHVTASGTHTHTIGSLNTSAITAGTLGVARGGTGAASFTANSAIISGSSTTAALTTRTIRNNTATSGAVTADTALITSNTLRYAINRTTSVAAADTNYTTLMARGIGLRNADTNPGVNGAINFTYE